jgi:hypothetical protein
MSKSEKYMDPRPWLISHFLALAQGGIHSKLAFEDAPNTKRIGVRSKEAADHVLKSKPT